MTASPPDRSGKQSIGASWDPARAVWADEDARMLVRGDRPEGASIHVAYATPVVQWDERARDELIAFEQDKLAELALDQTIVDEPPEEWMRTLELPDIPVRWNAATIEYLRFFKDDPKGRRMIAAWLNRMGRYEKRLRTILREAGVPEDLVYVAMVESGFDPGARSGVGAAGMWQFMEPTGRVYGLESAYWTDDRLDFERASFAAATYLADLHTRFGSWELALAAYNAGYGLVVQSIRANNTNNYWALSEIENGLPEQTSNYVPKILAAAIVGHNREVFGVEGKPDAARETIDVDVPAGTTLDDLAAAIEVDAKLLAELNANYLRGRVPPEGEPSPVRIPREAHARFTALGDSLRSADQPWSTFEVWLGDDLETIALAHGTTEKQLRKLNDIHDSGEIVGGTVLVVPTLAPDPASKPKPPLVAVPELHVPRGQTLMFFRVTRATGEQAVAKAFGVAWSQIVAWNDLDPHARMVDGQYLQVLVPEGFDRAKAKVRAYASGEVRKVVRGTVEHVDALLAERELVRRGYKVHKGDTLAKIAKKYELSLGSLARINGVPREHEVQPGDVLVLYVPASLTKGTHKPPKPRATSLTDELEIAEEIVEDDADSKSKAKPKKTPREASTPETSRVPGRPQ
ncbi:LysM peptidoglycan-binding domain-containing protein [Nannocystaceae bacterium ST9]